MIFLYKKVGTQIDNFCEICICLKNNQILPRSQFLFPGARKEIFHI